MVFKKSSDSEHSITSEKIVFQDILYRQIMAILSAIGNLDAGIRSVNCRRLERGVAALSSTLRDSWDDDYETIMKAEIEVRKRIDPKTEGQDGLYYDSILRQYEGLIELMGRNGFMPASLVTESY